MNEYYVYALIDPRDKSIFYIGKGKGDRYLDHEKNIGELKKSQQERKQGINPGKTQRIKNILDSGKEVEYKMIAENLSEEAAFALEEILVERFGRQSLRTGNLTNLVPGGKWDYPKVILEENEKITIEQIQNKYPELLSIIEQYPHVAVVAPIIIPWFEKKIPKELALFQYSIEGNYITAHYTPAMTSATGMSERMIKAIIKSNHSFIYDFQWSETKVDRMRNLMTIDQNEFEKMKDKVKRYKINDVTWLPGKEIYDKRIQEVEE